MEETFPKLFDCPDYLEGKYCHALCNYRHQTEEEKQASKFLIVCSIIIHFSIPVERYRESLRLKLNPKKSKRFGPVSK